jgi:hypothetical protein
MREKQIILYENEKIYNMSCVFFLFHEDCQILACYRRKTKLLIVSKIELVQELENYKK